MSTTPPPLTKVATAETAATVTVTGTVKHHTTMTVREKKRAPCSFLRSSCAAYLIVFLCLTQCVTITLYGSFRDEERTRQGSDQPSEIRASFYNFFVGYSGGGGGGKTWRASDFDQRCQRAVKERRKQSASSSSANGGVRVDDEEKEGKEEEEQQKKILFSPLELEEVIKDFECRRHIVFSALKCMDPLTAGKCTCSRMFSEQLAMHRLATMDPSVAYLYIPADAMRRNKFGLPTLMSLYQYAYAACPNATTYTYLNADIVFDDSFVPTVDAALAWAADEKLAGRPSEFLMAGPRYRVQVTPELFWQHGYEQMINGLRALKDAPKKPVHDRRCDSVDYFITTREAINWNAPGASEMVIARPGFDIWLVDRAYRSPTVSLITSNKTLAAGHLVDLNEDSNSNSEWMKKVNLEDKQFNNRMLWAPNEDQGWQVDWGQFGHPCAAYHRSNYVEDNHQNPTDPLDKDLVDFDTEVDILRKKTQQQRRHNNKKIIIEPSREQKIFFRYHPGKTFEDKRLRNWERMHQPVITSTIIVVTRSVQQLADLYPYLADRTEFTLFPGDKHRVDISLRIPQGTNASAGEVVGSNSTQIQYWVNDRAGVQHDWNFGRWEGTLVSRKSQTLKFETHINTAIRRGLLVRSAGWVNVVRAGITGGLSGGTRVTSKNTIVVDSAQLSTLLNKSSVTPPVKWYKWFHVIRKLYPSADGIYFSMENVRQRQRPAGAEEKGAVLFSSAAPPPASGAATSFPAESDTTSFSFPAGSGIPLLQQQRRRDLSQVLATKSIPSSEHREVTAAGNRTEAEYIFDSLDKERRHFSPHHHQFAWTFHPKAYTEYVKMTDSYRLRNSPYESVCMSVAPEGGNENGAANAAAPPPPPDFIFGDTQHHQANQQQQQQQQLSNNSGGTKNNKKTCQLIDVIFPSTETETETDRRQDDQVTTDARQDQKGSVVSLIVLTKTRDGAQITSTSTLVTLHAENHFGMFSAEHQTLWG